MQNFGIINSFITSCPSRIFDTLANFASNKIFSHLLVTCYETLIGFLLGTVLGTIIASMLWWSPFWSEVLEPYLIVLHSLPKVALGPIIIVWAGAGTGAIIVMALAISIIVTILEMYNGFNSTDINLIKLARTFNASKKQIFFKIVLPSNISTLINAMKVNIGLSLVGVISRRISCIESSVFGYLIVYGGQVFKLDLVMTSVIILGIVAAILYKCVGWFEKLILKFILHAQIK